MITTSGTKEKKLNFLKYIFDKEFKSDQMHLGVYKKIL